MEVNLEQAEAVGKAEWLGSLLDGAEEVNTNWGEFWWHHYLEVLIEVDRQLPAGHIYLCRVPHFDATSQTEPPLVYRVCDGEWDNDTCTAQMPESVVVMTYLGTNLRAPRVLWASPGYVPDFDTAQDERSA